FFPVLPYIEQDNPYRQSGGFVWKNGTCAVRIPVYLCPADASAPAENRFKSWLATSNYAANFLVFKNGGTRFPASFTDGLSNTIMFSERYQMCHGHPNAWGYYGYYYWTPMF